jgi:dolichyl-phosphate-mannose--protein O-mannosyl transferase
MSLAAPQEDLARPAPPAAGTPAGRIADRARFMVPPFSQLRSRLPPDRDLGWTVTLVVSAIAAALRLWGIGFPDRATYGYVFDETYYATESREMLDNGGYENNPGYMFIVHPPLGKWFIAAGQWLFTDRLHWPVEYGYRIPSAVAGTLAVLILVRAARRMTGSTLLGGIAGLLLAVDGLSVVESRLALLDIFLQTLVIGGFACLLVDRDRMRARLATAAEAGAVQRLGPRLGWRPWRLAAGMLLGLACGVKWSTIFFLAGFAILSLLWDRGARRSAGARRWTTGTALRDLPGAVLAMAVLPVLAYLATWSGWFLSENGYNRHWADTHPGRWSAIPGTLRSLWQYQVETLSFHRHLESAHPYQSKPWSWLVLGRPVSYYYPGGAQAPHGCGAATCVREILAIGTPALWWAFIPAIGWMVWLLVSRRDWRAGAVLAAFVAGWLAWLLFPGRTMFLFYMAPVVPFCVLAVTMALGDALGPASARDSRRFWGRVAVSGYLAVVILDFAWLHPLLVGSMLTYEQWHARIWFPSWI